MRRMIFATLFVAGCATPEPVEMDSARHDVSPEGDYAAAASCVHDYALANHPASDDVDLDSVSEGRASIVWVTTRRNDPLYSVEVRQRGERVRYNYAWAGEANQARAEAAIEACLPAS